MADNSIYQDIAKRTGGDIYIGVVGPVRTGKSTFIRKFLDGVVLPGIDNEFDRSRTLDEIPQSGSGKTIMTTEPKFVPDESVKIHAEDGTELNIKMVDCVGYMVDGALGVQEDGADRMVMTPWSPEAMPFSRAAEWGTEKVIGEHATIAVMVTTDGSFTDIPRENYIPAEERVARELKERGKPFTVVLNSARPQEEQTRALAASLEEKYGVPVALVDCLSLDARDMREILGLILAEFPVREERFLLPDWIDALPAEHPLRRSMLEQISNFAAKTAKLGDIERALSEESGIVRERVNAGDGTAEFSLPVSDELFYQTMSEMAGIPISNRRELFDTVVQLSGVKKEYSKIEEALTDVREKGYGIVMPDPEELELEEPKLVKQAGGWGVKVAARAESIHMIRAGIKAEFSPVVGTEEQSEEVVKYLTGEYEEDPKKVWESNMFGRSLYDLINDGMHSKLSHMPDESREKLGETLEKIINEGSNGLICILL